jgi:hypothetical protein
MGSVLWKINRIKAMGLPEILYRINNIKKEKSYKYLYRKDTSILKALNLDINLSNIDKNITWINENINFSNIKESSQYKIFESSIDIYTNHIDWYKCTNNSWDNNKSSFDYEFKNNDEVGDVRYTWEINRMQYLPYILCLYKKNKDEKYIAYGKNIFYDWIDKNPFLKGPNWSSPMEIAIRSYQWFLSYYLLKDCGLDEFRVDLIKATIFSLKYVSQNFSKFSSANNHLIVEAAIASIIGYSVKDIYSNDWFNKGYNILYKEVNRQFYDDGINKEQAMHYQAFVVDMMLQYNIFLRSIGKSPISQELLKKTLTFMASLSVERNNFDYGDSDDAKILCLENARDKNYYEYILALGTYYYKEKFCELNIYIPEVQLFFNEASPDKFIKMDNFKYYDKGGYFVISDDSSKLLFDCGALGFGSIAAHGHADALSVIYYYKDKPIFIDSGTYIYNSEKYYRDYFRSTRSHNTLNYNKKDQSQMLGPFLWGKKACCKLINLENAEDIIEISAEHDGYKPLIHRRKLQYNKGSKKIIIEDYFDDNAEINFILDPKCKVERINNNRIRLAIDGANIYFESNYKVNIEKGLISKKFMKKEETKKIVITKDKGDKTVIIIEPK